MVEWWSKISETVMQGLQITVIGMTLVFFTLGLIIVAMVLLTKLPWLQAKEEEEGSEEESPAPAIASATVAVPAPVAAAAPADDELAQVAAIAVAVLRGQEVVVPVTRGLGRPQVRATGGAWRSYGRAHQLG